MAGESHPLVKVFRCPSCGAGVVLRAQGRSVSAICGSCKATIDVANENLRVISSAAAKITIEPEIPLGSRGKLFGQPWEAIGFMQRCDQSGAYHWQEYLLFNPYQGYRWLVEDSGHWSFVRMLREQPAGDFKLFNKGKAVVTFVLGEFYWRVSRGDTVDVQDAIDPPRVASLEVDPTERMWSLGEYVEPEVIRQAFKLQRPLKPRLGIAPNQPSGPRTAWDGSRKAWGIFAAALLGIQIFTVALSPGKSVFVQTFTYDPAIPQKPVLIPDLQLEGRGNVRIKFYAPVRNSWLEVSGALTREEGGESFPFEHSVEYYFGFDSDGFWEEGANQGSELISSVPGGRYSLTFQVAGPNVASSPNYVPPAGTQRSVGAIDYTLTIERGVPVFSNFFWALLMLSLYPLILWLRSRSYEVSRWSNSDFSPYAIHPGGSDE